MRLVIAFFLACLAAAVVPLLGFHPKSGGSNVPFPGWPAQFEGRLLTGIPLSERETRFARDFPGKVGRFTDGQREYVLRWVTAETRQLHPAADCFKGIGFTVQPQPLLVDAAGNRWSRFAALKGAESYLVRERIHDPAGQSWSDVSAWYWAAFWGKTTGPWWAVTVVEPNPAPKE